MFRKRKIKIEDERQLDSESRRQTKEAKWVASLLLSTSKISFFERFLKIFIYLALRLAIWKPSRWRDPQKNFEIIDRTYKKITSNDFAFIPSSIAFYIVISFAPILLIISAIYQIPGFEEFFKDLNGTEDPIKNILGGFLPGINGVIDTMKTEIGKLSFSSWTGWLGFLLFMLPTLWVAASGFAKLIYTESYVFQHKYIGNYWVNKMRGLMMVLLITFVLAFALSINVFIEIRITNLPWTKTGKQVLKYFYLICSLGILLFSGISIFFKISPRFKIKLRHTLPGGMVSALPTVVFFSVFGAIVNNKVVDYSKFGVIGFIMYLALASFWFTYFVYLGMITNASYHKTFVTPNVMHKWPFWKR